MTMNTMTTAGRARIVTATALFGAFVFSFATLPAAADGLSLPTATVKFGDLDVLHPQGAAVLYARIQAAAMNVCSSFDGLGLGHGAALHRDGCVNKAIVGAVTQVDSPALSAVYNAHEGKELPTRLTSLPNSLTTSAAR
jgi:UrcA family protein